MDRLLLTVPEAAETCGYSRAFLYTAIQRGEIPVIRLGRTARIPKAWLEKWVTDQVPTGDGAISADGEDKRPPQKTTRSSPLPPPPEPSMPQRAPDDMTLARLDEILKHLDEMTRLLSSIDRGIKGLNERDAKKAQSRKAVGATLRQQIIRRDGWVCRYCGKRVSKDTLQIDHVIPVDQGGTADESNLVVSCVRCNRLKGYRTIEEAGMKLLPIPEHT